MSNIEIDGTFDVDVNNRWPGETMIRFKLFGCIVHTERYPKYLEGDAKLETAIRDAKHRFAGRLRDSLKQLETV
jgi:hypothetical protein